MKTKGSIGTYTCCKCAKRFQRFAWEGNLVTCECGYTAKPVAPPTRQGFRPLLNDAIGVHASQVAEHRRLHPDIEMTDDGAVVIRSAAENERVCKKLGFEPK